MGHRHGRSRRKPSGGLLRRSRKHRKSAVGRDPAHTRIGETGEVRAVTSRGGNTKQRAKQATHANVSSDGESEAVEILNVVENPANPDFVRRDILTRGARIETEKGEARVTSRPGQDGTVNAVLVDE